MATLMSSHLFPRGGNAFTQGLGALVLKMTGWKSEIDLPNLPKSVVICAPHTSNWDLVYTMAFVFANRLKFHWFGKHTLFKAPFGGFMRWLGGIAIDRRAAGGVVAETARAFNNTDKLAIGIAPEGTRTATTEWKSGWHQIAMSANVPVVLAYVDYGRKVVGCHDWFQPTGNYAEDLAFIKGYYQKITPRFAEHFRV
jgi:1-acyl-sn-glycerol-3-phosphate acyltransferase